MKFLFLIPPSFPPWIVLVLAFELCSFDAQFLI